MLFFTEKGLYRYLLQSRRVKAEEFQDYVYDLIISERQRTVDAALLDAKLARDALALANETFTEKLKIAQGFQLRAETTFDDYKQWAYDRLEADHPLLAGGAWSPAELAVLSHYFMTSYFEDGYEDLVAIRSGEVEDVAPQVYRAAAEQHRTKAIDECRA
jgi:hypothetical protein